MTPESSLVAARQSDTPARSDTGELRAHFEALVSAYRQKMQQERLSAFREMAGEVAHDFTDTLSSILARAQILAADAQDQEVVQSVRMIERVALEGTRIVRRLQDFSRTRPARPFQPVDLNPLVSEIVSSIRARWHAQLAPRSMVGEVHAELGNVPMVSRDAAEPRNVLSIIGVADRTGSANPGSGRLEGSARGAPRAPGPIRPHGSVLRGWRVRFARARDTQVRPGHRGRRSAWNLGARAGQPSQAALARHHGRAHDGLPGPPGSRRCAGKWRGFCPGQAFLHRSGPLGDPPRLVPRGLAPSRPRQVVSLHTSTSDHLAPRA